MPVENLRLVVQGVPDVEGKFDLMIRDKRDAQRLAEQLAKASDQERAELERALRDQLRSR